MQENRGCCPLPGCSSDEVLTGSAWRSAAGVMVEVRVGARVDPVASTRDANGGGKSVTSAHLDFAGEVDLFTPILEGILQGRE